MGRDIDRDTTPKGVERAAGSGKSASGRGTAGNNASPSARAAEKDPGRPDKETETRFPEPDRDRQKVRGDDPISPQARDALRPGRMFQMSPTELETLRDIGRFRTVAVEDLTHHRYAGEGTQMQQDLRSLMDQGLIQKRTAWLNNNQGKLSVVVLTRAGKNALEQVRDQSSAQVFFSGFVKPAEVAHDAAIYRMFHKESARIEKDGGKIRRVVLDYELKQKVYSPLAKARALPPLEYAKRQIEVAQATHLKVVAGKIPLPDLRIEYETAEGDLTRVDLELATHHYHGSHLRVKAEAGFKMYAAGDSVSRCSAALDGPEITAEIFSL